MRWKLFSFYSNFQLVTNETTGEKSIRCRNPEGTCARHICECDKRMAEGLARWEDAWDVNFHTGRNNGAWKYDDNCKKKGLGRSVTHYTRIIIILLELK